MTSSVVPSPGSGPNDPVRLSSSRNDAAPLEETVAVVGIGLIGGSLAGAVRERRLAGRVIGVGRNADRLKGAVAAGLIDEFTLDLKEASERASLLIFATPVDQIVAGIQESQAGAHTGLLITDAGSTKQEICEALGQSSNFIGSHPIAGSHERGYLAAKTSLFTGKVCVITPTETSPPGEVARLKRFWEGLGMIVQEMSPAAHDAALAQTSHLPHVVAAALANVLEEINRPFVGSGFRDATRIAAGDADLWVSILQSNVAPVTQEIERVREQLQQFQQALLTGNTAILRELLHLGQRTRESLS